MTENIHNIGSIGNIYGSLSIKQEETEAGWKFYWAIGDDWEEIPRYVHDSLLYFEKRGLEARSPWMYPDDKHKMNVVMELDNEYSEEKRFREALEEIRDVANCSEGVEFYSMIATKALDATSSS